MNDLRVILLVIGIALIACIYLWETLKQKRNLRSRVENYPAPARKAPRLEPAAENNSGGDQEPAYFNLLLNQDRTPAAGPSAVNLEAIPGVVANPDRSDETATGGEAGKPGREAAQEIMVIYILADEHPYFKGPEILKAAAAAEMKYGNMRVFHYHGPDRKHSRRPLFSL
ncbi:MAG: cell division protein ZipA C-terminal FtsZ-binding domain-containing protein, partial [Gammaproteobacteria bacterium]